MCFIHFKMSINVQVMPKMYILLTGNLPCLPRVRRKQQIKERPGGWFQMKIMPLRGPILQATRYYKIGPSVAKIFLYILKVMWSNN